MAVNPKQFLAFITLSSALIVLVFMCHDQEYVTITGQLSREKRDLERVRTITGCEDRNVDFKVEQRGKYFVFYNFVRAEKRFQCHESITYTTQSDYSFLDNLPALTERWRGPLSIALYAPGDDFSPTLRSIAYLRNCKSPLIKELVTFHVFFTDSHMPTQQGPLIEAYNDSYPCDKGPPYANVTPDHLYKRKHNLTYPINIARNVARQTAATHYILASDIELYPTPHFIPKFLNMILNHPEYEYRKNPRVYALAIFEVLANETIPENKADLLRMMSQKRAFLFHRRICSVCHAVPKYKEWLKAKENEGLQVFTVGKRINGNKMWEAFYVGTHNDPLFDERLTWEGQSNKMTQAYSLCLLDYDYMVLDNAFLVHKPGVKKSKEQLEKYKKLVGQTNYMLKHKYKPELKALYGNRDSCYL